MSVLYTFYAEKTYFCIIIILSTIRYGRQTKDTTRTCNAFRYDDGNILDNKILIPAYGIQNSPTATSVHLHDMFVPILGYIYIRKYRERYCGGELSFLRGWVFSLYMYFFASLLTAAAHYIYFQFIDNGYLTGTYMDQLESLKATLTGDLETSVDQLIQNLETIASMSALQLTMQLIFQNIFYGAILSLPTALLAMRRKKNS